MLADGALKGGNVRWGNVCRAVCDPFRIYNTRHGREARCVIHNADVQSRDERGLQVTQGVAGSAMQISTDWLPRPRIFPFFK